MKCLKEGQYSERTSLEPFEERGLNNQRMDLEITIMQDTIYTVIMQATSAILRNEGVFGNSPAQNRRKT